VPHVGRFNRYLLEDFRSKVFQELGFNNNVIPFRKLYITRKSARRRKITNEQNLLDEMNISGFEQVKLEDLAWAEQIKLFSETKVVVSNHGAGLSNIMFMKAGTIVIELKALNNDYWCFFSLARVCNLKYEYILCQATGSDHRNADINVDVDTLIQKLKGHSFQTKY
jgi:capsular polysaccharide biosynthesis protein